MNRKHYVQLADILGSYVPKDILLNGLLSDVSAVLKSDNSNFDMLKFVDATINRSNEKTITITK
jgi:hypothetical protein